MLFNREYEQDLNERNSDSISRRTDYFKTGNILLVDGDGEWVGPDDEEDDNGKRKMTNGISFLM